MSSEIPAKLEDVQRVSKSLRYFFMFAAALTVLGLFAAIFGPEARTIELAGTVFPPESATVKIEIVWLARTVLGAAIYLKAFFHLIKLFGLYAEGRIFTLDNVRQIRQLGITMLLLPAVWILVLLAVLPEVAGAENGLIRIMPSFPMLAGLGGGIVLLIAWIMDVGREMRDEQELVI